VHDGNFYDGEQPGDPAVGDMRVRFSAVNPQDVSIVALQHGNSLSAYHASAGSDIKMLRPGIVGATDMFEIELKKSSSLTWSMRFFGWFVMFIGLVFLLRPLSLVSGVAPRIGTLLALGTAPAALAMSVVLSIATIGTAWVVYRPFLGITLLVAATVLSKCTVISANKKIAAKAAALSAT
jgi:hypothetical protein